MIKFQIKTIHDRQLNTYQEIDFELPYSINKGIGPFSYTTNKGDIINYNPENWVCLLTTPYKSEYKKPFERSLSLYNAFTPAEFEKPEDAVEYCVQHYLGWLKTRFEMLSEAQVNLFGPNDRLLSAVRKQVLADSSKGSRCPCCDQYVKVYKRKLNSGMAYGLINMLKVQGSSTIFIHVPEEFTRKNINAMNMEFSKLKYWGLVEEQPNEENPEKRCSGYWRITEKGRLFATNQIKINKYVYLYNSKLHFGEDKTEISILDALGDKFNYEELMAPYFN